MSGYRDRFEKEINRVGVSRIAQVLGVARNTVYNWMANGNAPLNQLLALEGLGIDIVYVLTGTKLDVQGLRDSEVHQVNQNVRPYGLSDDEAALLDAYRSSTPEMQAAALRVLTASPIAEPSRPSAREFGPAPDRGSQPRILGEKAVSPASGKTRKKA